MLSMNVAVRCRALRKIYEGDVRPFAGLTWKS